MTDDDTTPKQRRSRARNAAKATEARRNAAAERRAQAEAKVEETYGPVRREVRGALEALVAGKQVLMSRRIQAALLLLAEIAVTGPYDPARSRQALLALREAQAEARRFA